MNKEQVSITGYANLTVEKAVGKGKKEKVYETLTNPEVIMAETDGTRVRMTVSSTKNLGNYESAKIELGIDYPTTKEQITQAQKEVTEIVEGWLAEKLKELDGLPGNK